MAAARAGSSGSTTPPTFDPKPEAKTLNFYNWTDYIADDTIPNFQKETGIKVTYDNYSSNDELFNKLSAGSTGYDIIVPTDATLVKMKHADLVEPLDLSLIPEREEPRPALHHCSRTTPATSTPFRGSGAPPASATTRRRSKARSPTGMR